MSMDYIKFFHFFKADARARYLILGASIIGTAFGFYYYEWQLRASPIYYWPLIPDSPFFTLMFVFVLAAYSFGKRSNLFDTFAFIGLNKIGFWTLFVLLYDFNYYFTPETRVFRSVLFLLHIGMILCSFTLLKDMKRPKINKMGLLLVIFLIADYFDYIIGTHPYLNTPRIDVIGWAALVLTLGCWGFVWLIKPEHSPENV
jgi:uncharacterized membrane protein YpjA